MIPESLARRSPRGSQVHAPGNGKTEHRRWRPAGVQRRAGIWAPEELPVGSLNTYMMLTFLTLAHARGLNTVGYESEAKLEPARKTMEGVEAQCFIANSVKARVTLTPEFVVAPPTKVRTSSASRERSIVWKTI